MQKKPFSFRLLPFTLTGLCALSFMLSALSSCWFNPPLQGKGTGFIQGEWKQDSLKNTKQLITYSLYHVTFNCDSFFVRMENYSKVNYGADSCMKNGHWFEYAKGGYDQRGDTLHLKGFYCNANYSLKDPGGCFNVGVYEDFFKIASHRDSTLDLSSLSNTIPVKLKLIKRLSCVPKPL